MPRRAWISVVTAAAVCAFLVLIKLPRPPDAAQAMAEVAGLPHTTESLPLPPAIVERPLEFSDAGTATHVLARRLGGSAFFRPSRDNAAVIMGPVLVSAASRLVTLPPASWSNVCPAVACHLRSLLPGAAGSCLWCSRDAQRCIRGQLSLALTRVPLAPPRDCKWCVVDRVPAAIARERSYGVQLVGNASHQVRFVTLLAKCELESAATGEGTLTSSSVLGVDFVAQVAAPLLPPVAAESSRNAVCGRALFGDLSAASLVKWVEHYTSALDFDVVIVYQVGFSSVFPASLGPLMDSGRLVFVDLRDTLQQSYGALFWDVLLFSSYVGQGFVKVDCHLRARAAGAQWVLHVDMDELLFLPGPPPWKWSSLRLGDARVVSFPRKTLLDPAACELSSAGEWYRMTQQQKQMPIDCKDLPGAPACNELMGMNKIAVRVDGARELNAAGLGIHNYRFCGYVQPAGKVDDCLDGVRVAYIVSYDGYLLFVLPRLCR